MSRELLEGNCFVEVREVGVVAEWNQRSVSASASWSQQTVDLIAAFNTKFKDVEMGGKGWGGESEEA